MADSPSESDSSSLDGGAMLPPSPVSREHMQKRIESLQQQNKVLKVSVLTKDLSNLCQFSLKLLYQIMHDYA